MLKQRVITALLLAPAVLWALFGLADDYLILLFSAVLLLGSYEWLRLSEINVLFQKTLFLTLQVLLFVGVWWLVTSNSPIIIPILISIVLAWFLIVFWLVMFQMGKVSIQLSRHVRMALGLILLATCLLGVAAILYWSEHDRVLLLFMFLLIWGADVAAYFSGKAFGKRKLAPAISPGKSWEGVYGALAGTIVISSAFSIYMGYSGGALASVIMLSLVVVLISIAGDLFESLLKRQVGIKDSSNILPGHGGILDRVDSMIAASPVFALGIYSLGIM